MKRIKLVVAYDGTNYQGWQIQRNGETIESMLNRALQSLTGEPIRVMGASRTDSGVHALGNVAVFDTEARMPGDKFSYALNQRLPEDIRIQASCEVPGDFHPRYQETVKTYEYRILNREFPLPSCRLNTYFTYYTLDVDRMCQAAAFLTGEHDFKSFCAAGAQVKTTIRTIYDLQIRKDEDLLTIRITGNGFLYNMVRIIAGTLMKVGTGEWEPEYIEEILKAKDRRKAGPTAPAKGLTLLEIRFLGEKSAP
ncbi:MAG: tRNA pseudouridine(38-40) synthase TruA [Lachnospiraceae bacterium]|nr:tRNA pseudouridine(38-40) synthase TruA [Lachnospiraceae bacterium]MCI9658694.1 tRNA pseudouridine(38-40) synthase TruA [Lachnospiraceae bacterium]